MGAMQAVIGRIEQLVRADPDVSSVTLGPPLTARRWPQRSFSDVAVELDAIRLRLEDVHGNLLTKLKHVDRDQVLQISRALARVEGSLLAIEHHARSLGERYDQPGK
jgi:hypothetical protein